MKVLGITGSIGMGKTTTANMFARLGVPVFDSDKYAHKALEQKSPVFKAIAKSFPTCWDNKKAKIDRKELGRIVFSDPDKKELLESYVHPYVKSEQQKFIKAMRAKGVDAVLIDIPLLFETGAEEYLDKVIVVTAPFFIQTQRVMARPNMDIEKFNAILASQMSDAEKRGYADYVVQTGIGLSNTQGQVRAIMRDIEK